MGLRDELQADLAEAFNTDLADAVLAFAGEYMGAGIRDPISETTTAQPVIYTGRGCFRDTKTAGSTTSTSKLAIFG